MLLATHVTAAAPLPSRWTRRFLDESGPTERVPKLDSLQPQQPGPAPVHRRVPHFLPGRRRLTETASHHLGTEAGSAELKAETDPPDVFVHLHRSRPPWPILGGWTPPWTRRQGPFYR